MRFSVVLSTFIIGTTLAAPANLPRQDITTFINGLIGQVEGSVNDALATASALGTNANEATIDNLNKASAALNTFLAALAGTPSGAVKRELVDLAPVNQALNNVAKSIQAELEAATKVGLNKRQISISLPKISSGALPALPAIPALPALPALPNVPDITVPSVTIGKRDPQTITIPSVTIPLSPATSGLNAASGLLTGALGQVPSTITGALGGATTAVTAVQQSVTSLLTALGSLANNQAGASAGAGASTGTARGRTNN